MRKSRAFVTAHNRRLSALQKESRLLSGERASGRSKWVPQPVSFHELSRLWNPFHRRCIELKALTSVGFGWTATDGGEDEVVLPGNNTGETAHDVLNVVSDDLETTGNGFIELVFTAGGKIGEMYWLPASLMEVDKDRESVHQVVAGTKKTPSWPIFRGAKPEGEDRAVLHLRLPGTWSTYYGQPSWLGCVEDVMLADSAVTYQRKMFDNNNIPATAVILTGTDMAADNQEQADVDDDDDLLPDALTEFQRFLNANYGGVENAGKSIVMSLPNPEAKMIVERFQQNTDTILPVTKLLAACRDNIVSGHGVPPRLVGVVVSGSLGGAGEVEGQLRLFQQLHVRPRQRLWQAAFRPVLPLLEKPAQDIFFRSLDVDELAALAPAPAPGEPTVEGELAEASAKLERALAALENDRG